MKAISFAVIALCLVLSGCGGSDSNSNPTAPSRNVPFSTVDLRVGTGAEAVNGRIVTMNYSGWVYEPAGTDNKGSRFDAGTLSNVTLPGNFIQGFSQGVVGMRVGGLRRITIPPNLAYGNNPPPNTGIRANETLIFEVELVSVQ